MNLQRNSILCPRCRKLISTNEPECPYCHMSAPGARWKQWGMWQLFEDSNQLIRTIIYINIGIYVISLFFNSHLPQMSMNPFSILSPDQRSLILAGATGTIPIEKMGRWWTLLSANYLHGGILHIVFNLMAFRQLAPFVCREYGNYRMFAIYTLSGVLGYWISYMANIPLTIGASAAICGLMGAILYYARSRGGTYGKALYRQVIVWAVTLAVFGFIVPGINNWGHGGGFVGGILFGYLLSYHAKRPEIIRHRRLAWLCFFATVAVLAWAIGTGTYYRIFM
jgi:membrane associated rhomboid family serine protease